MRFHTVRPMLRVWAMVMRKESRCFCFTNSFASHCWFANARWNVVSRSLEVPPPHLVMMKESRCFCFTNNFASHCWFANARWNVVSRSLEVPPHLVMMKESRCFCFTNSFASHCWFANARWNMVSRSLKVPPPHLVMMKESRCFCFTNSFASHCWFANARWNMVSRSLKVPPPHLMHHQTRVPRHHPAAVLMRSPLNKFQVYAIVCNVKSYGCWQIPDNSYQFSVNGYQFPDKTLPFPGQSPTISWAIWHVWATFCFLGRRVAEKKKDSRYNPRRRRRLKGQKWLHPYMRPDVRFLNDLQEFCCHFMRSQSSLRHQPLWQRTDCLDQSGHKSKESSFLNVAQPFVSNGRKLTVKKKDSLHNLLTMAYGTQGLEFLGETFTLRKFQCFNRRIWDIYLEEIRLIFLEGGWPRKRKTAATIQEGEGDWRVKNDFIHYMRPDVRLLNDLQEFCCHFMRSQSSLRHQPLWQRTDCLDQSGHKSKESSFLNVAQPFVSNGRKLTVKKKDSLHNLLTMAYGTQGLEFLGETFTLRKFQCFNRRIWDIYLEEIRLEWRNLRHLPWGH